MDSALQLLNQYTIHGTQVPLAYNDQIDTELRMINLINDAQMQIATTVKPIEKLITLSVPEPDINDPVVDLTFIMPDDFNYALGITYTPLKGRIRTSVEANRYKWLDEHHLLLPSKPGGTYTITYNAYPIRYAADVERTTPLENTPDTHEAIPYYVAAMLALDENASAYQALYNVFETRLSRLGNKPAHATVAMVTDAYNFFNGAPEAEYDLIWRGY